MWSMKVILLLLCCYACQSTGKGKVNFVSRNFYNILHWDPAKPDFPGEKVLYSVQYLSYGEEQPYHIKEECQNITSLSCNLTAETPSVHDAYYLAQVLVKGRIHGRTNRFNPLTATILGSPILSTHATTSSLHVNVTLPLGPNGVSVADIITNSKKGPSKGVITYTLTITHPKWAAQDNKTTTDHFVINLKNQMEYCGYVFYQPYSCSKSENATFCVTLKDDPLKLLSWLLVGAAVWAAIVIMSVMCMCSYVKGGKKKSMPQLLRTTFSTPLNVLQPPDTSISKLVYCPKSDRTVYATLQVNPKVHSVGVGGYSPQDIPCQDWEGSTGSSVVIGAHSPTPNSTGTSAQSSETYGLVVVHDPAKENKDFQQANIEDRGTSNLPMPSSGESWDKGGMSPQRTSHGVPPLPDLDPCEIMPLLLHTVRDHNGQLMLPTLTFQLQSSTGGTERKPLLSDLIDYKTEGPSLASLQSFDGSEMSDSGFDDSTVNTPTLPYCNSHYFPSQPVVPDFTPSSDAISHSGYKQNWLPAILLEATPKDSCEYRRTNYPCTWTAPKEEEEGEDEEDRAQEERSRQNLLGGWMVQIKE